MVFLLAEHPSAPPQCVSYDGCAAGVPALFCRHDLPDFAPAAVWSFFDRLR